MKYRIFTILLTGLLLAILSIAWTASPARAAPALPGEVPITQPDGTTFAAYQWGDENRRGLETAEGFTIIRETPGGFWVYAAQENGRLVPARQRGRPLVVGKDAPAGLVPHLRLADQLRVEALEEPVQNLAEFSPSSGSHNLLMVLVNFTNRQHIYSPADFHAKAFGSSGSIADYYTRASFGSLTIIPAPETWGTPNDGVVEVNLDFDHPNPSIYDNSGFNAASQAIASSAFQALDPYVNLAAFDTDGDGYVTSSELHVVFIVSGYEQAYSSVPAPGIWAHRSSLANTPEPLKLDGKYVGIINPNTSKDGGYSIFGEIHGYDDAKDHIAQIGIMVHELGHDLSWPDLYDTNLYDNENWQGAGNWSVMGTGSWNKSQQYGDSPAMPDAFLKWYQGWISPVQAGTGNTYTLRPGESNPDALLVGRNPGGIDWGFYKQSGTGEYWLVENRQKDGYDAGLPGCGILVWHIDETVRNDNLANANRTRPLAALEEADGLGQLYRNDELSNRGDPGDPFPGTANNMTWGTGTSPDSAFYSGALSGHGLEVAAPGYNAANCQTMDIAVSYDGPVDTTSPTVTVNQAGDQPDPANNAPVLFTAVFSEPVTGFASDDILFDGSTAPGALSAAVTGSGATYTIAVSGMTGSGNVVISIPASAAQDSQGNANTASISVDNTVLFEIIIKTFYLPVLSSLPSAPVLPAGYPRQAAR